MKAEYKDHFFKDINLDKFSEIIKFLKEDTIISIFKLINLLSLRSLGIPIHDNLLALLDPLLDKSNLANIKKEIKSMKLDDTNNKTTIIVLHPFTGTNPEILL